MQPKLFRASLFALSTTAVLSLSASAVVIGGIDPGTAPVGATDGPATNFTVIGKVVTLTGASGLDLDLSSSTFSYQSNGKVSASASPFLAIQGAGGIHDINNYDVIWIGTSLAKAGSTVDVSAPLGAGTFSLPANATIVGGYWSAASESPVSYTDNSGSGDDTLILAGLNVDVTNELTLTGTDWSANAGVADRDYHYQIDLQSAVIPEPSTSILFGLAGLGIMVRRRR